MAARYGAPAAQPGRQWRDPLGREVRLQARPDRGVARQGGRVQAAGDRSQVQPGPAGEDRGPASLGDGPEGGTGMVGEVRHAERLVGVDEVEAVVRDPGALGDA